MRVSLRILLVAFLTATEPRAETGDVRGLTDRVDGVLAKWNRPDVPGCVTGIGQRGAPPLIRAYGSADLEHAVPIDAATVFEAGSVAKQFTAAAVLLLVEQGKLTLDDDVRKYLPELPDYGARITVARLLDHTSGLRDWEGVVEIAGWPVTTRVYSVADVLELAARQKRLNHAPGTEFSYTNTGFVLLGIVVERVSGVSLARFTREHLFVPLAMERTQWRDDFRRVVHGRAIAYDAVPGGYRALMPFHNVIGAGGLLTTVGDLLRWNDALDNGALGKFVTAELQRRSTLIDGRPIGYARGVYVGERHGLPIIWHSGETAGYEAFLARYPDQHLSIAVLCNNGPEAEIDSLGDRIADLVLPARPPAQDAVPSSSRISVPVAQLAHYAGLYFAPHFAVQMALALKDGALRRVSDGMLLTPAGAGAFRTSISTIRFTGNGHVLRDFDDGRRWEFDRIQPWHPDGAGLAAFAGTYRSDEAGATCVVSVANGHLAVAIEDRQLDIAQLDPVARDTFSKPHHAYRFHRDAGGRVVSLEISNGWEHVYGLVFDRVAGIPAPQAGR